MTYINGDNAFKISLANRNAKWQGRRDRNNGPVYTLPEFAPSFSLVEGEALLTIGSCFARHIEIYLKREGYCVPAFEYTCPAEELWTTTKMRPGLLNKYTPHSMLNEITFATGTSDGSEFLVEVPGGVIDGQLHTNVPVSMDRALERRQEMRSLYLNALRECRIAIVTLGLIESWWDRESEVYLNETPLTSMMRAHPSRFEFRVLGVDETIQTVNLLLASLKQFGRPDQRTLLTVSPVPLQRTFTSSDVRIANTYSKSLLRVAAQSAVETFDWVDYFPSYESITQSDPEKTWEDDLVHVKMDAVHANVNRMLQLYGSN